MPFLKSEPWENPYVNRKKITKQRYHFSIVSKIQFSFGKIKQKSCVCVQLAYAIFISFLLHFPHGGWHYPWGQAIPSPAYSHYPTAGSSTCQAWDALLLHKWHQLDQMVGGGFRQETEKTKGNELWRHVPWEGRWPWKLFTGLTFYTKDRTSCTIYRAQDKIKF